MPHNLLVDGPEQGVQIFTLNRPDVRNALNTELLNNLCKALDNAEADPEVHAVVITGNQKAFAAGADINEMAARDLVGILEDPRVAHWERIARFTKPIIAAVNGFALGGGCELAMHADILIAGENARFGQPEINLGIMPGSGGTQRLTRKVGEALAMHMTLTGEQIDATRALQAGLISEICQPELTVERAIEIGKTIARKAPIAIRLTKESVRKANDISLSDGLRFERHAFTLLAGTADRQEGLDAFREKRAPRFKGK
ncbi:MULTISPECIES: 2,3-dehydroadipyl-CoA hydratase PaaF [Marinobacter]|jgi:enoyl-CoA hydratase|uniref:2,3-dehydroadipyl-CoA hydratase PaaF n=1 Tax=Marinobacter TaxID=2742 RepID=UPI000948D061|nr:MULTISPECIES: 2,3-dehydroadipyl-CoA hydratase PaaF [Marinobacter]MCZ4286416.1 2,3-dehydroadipyl-CoA hydratase [Marinobacter salarius]MDC8455252.1 2,3-dehydroadipyl-CoA hydratase [Marinobacter sp. DS40M6]MDM8180819.1 2,3-dehydroadipyl-CoA hydratase [Marinobacter salarius]OLF84717.1 2,3-dehydroadipyl-CoA hydratase [Marinobacter sp. C18]RUT73732.1 2,3-dehydroadipyl-CoA hydratase [Marinobacter sp. NP-6]